MAKLQQAGIGTECPTEAVPQQAPAGRTAGGPPGVWRPNGTALLACRRLRGALGQRFRTDCSTLSALNVEVTSRALRGSPLAPLAPRGGSGGLTAVVLELRAFRYPRELRLQKQAEPGGSACVLAAKVTCTAVSAMSPEETHMVRNTTEDTRVPDSETESSVISEGDSHSEPTAEANQFEEVRRLFLGFRHTICEAAPEEIDGLNAKVSMPQLSRQTTPIVMPMAMSLQLSSCLPAPNSVVPPNYTPRSAQQLLRQVTPNFPRQLTPNVLARQVTPKAPRTFQQSPMAAMENCSPLGRQTSGDVAAFLTPTRPFRGKQDDLKRTVQGLLNKVCPENVGTIVQKVAAIEIKEAAQLETVIELIFKKAVTEPHYCETYADLVFSLKSVFPEFPSPDGGKPISFKSSVLNICQAEFEELLTSIEPTPEEKALSDIEEVNARRKKRKDRMLANMKFVGHLYLRQLLSAKVIGSVSRELVHNSEEAHVLPEEHALECACELLLAIGFTLETLPTGQLVIQQLCSRLLELKSTKTPAGRPAYSKRIQFMIQDLLDTRAAGWSKKLFKHSAKTKEEIRLEQEREIDARQFGLEPPAAEHVVAGQRPIYLATVVGA